MSKTSPNPGAGAQPEQGGGVVESSAAQPRRKRGGPGRPFKPGQSGNPGGKTKERKAAEDELREWARKVFDEEGRDAVLRIAKFAKDGRVMLAAWELVLDRAYGKAPTTATIKGDPEAPMSLHVNLVPFAWKVPDKT